MTPRQRTVWAGRIRQNALSWAVGYASNNEIDALGILRATRLAMQRAVEGLPQPPDHLLVDALVLRQVDTAQTSLYKGESVSISIAAASVLAKTARDEGMLACEQEYPGYGFARHKGYGTRLHHENLQRLGPCAIHRVSFAPVRAWRQAGD
jgi:ribonuclease HII